MRDSVQAPVAHGLVVRVLLLILWSSYFYLGTEWLFFVTKPSLLNALTAPQQVRVLFASPLALAIVCAVPGLVLALMARPFVARTRWALWLPAVVPAAVLTAAEILLIDNFTYTMLGFGFVTASGPARYVYAPLILALLTFNGRMLAGKLGGAVWFGGRERMALIATAVLVATSAAGLAIEVQSRPRLPSRDDRVAIDRRSQPNVLIFSMDGVNAARMSAYGYERKTTPHMETLLPDSLVFENHFSNSAKTTGAVGALLTGKLPTTTRVIFPPDTFHGVNAYQHLPGLLRVHGYVTGDFSTRHYGDARDLNLRESFDRSMDRDVDWAQLALPIWGQRALPMTASFLNETYDRVGSRIMHAFGLQELENVYEVVAAPDKHRTTDRKRVDALAEFIRTARRPFFAHTHLLSTHGPIFQSEQRVFSTSRQADEHWQMDSQDDAILQVDRYLNEIWSLLVERGLAEETLLIINADHGYRWSTITPIPLIMRFPNRARVGSRTHNSQRIDIAPTILDFLQIPRPGWMEGRSLLSDPIDPLAPIVIVNRAASENVDGWRVVTDIRPPFYSLGWIAVNYCNVQYNIRLPEGRMMHRYIRGHSAPCPRKQIPDRRSARQFLLGHLEERGYDVSSLKGHP